METSHELIESDIFLPIELNKSLQNLLIKVHHYFREEETNDNVENDGNEAKLEEEKRLREIFSIILECPVLRDKIVWFNSWSRKPTDTDNYEIRFIKDSNEIPRAIINISGEEKYKKYVSSLSALAKDYNYEDTVSKKRQFPLDYSYLISTENSTECNIEMASQYIKGFFVYLHFEKVKNLFENREFDKYHDEINKITLKKHNDLIKKKIIEILENSYERLKKHTSIEAIVDELSYQLSHGWGFGSELKTKIKNNEIIDSKGKILEYDVQHKDNIIRLINYFFWTKLAYPEEWKVLLYLPGVIAKGYEGVPLGVNIGLKEMVPLEVMIFLKRAVLLFFTRASIDYFEEVTKGTIISRGRRTAVAAIMARNMSHNIGSHVLANITKNEIKTRPEDMIMLTSFLQQRMDFIASITARQKQEWTEPIFFYSDLLQEFLNQGLLLDYLVRDDGYCASDKNYRGIQFRVKKDNLETVWTFPNGLKKNQKESEEFSRFVPSRNDYDDFLVSIPGGAVGKQAFYGFLENAMRNAAKYNPKENSLEVFIEVIENGNPEHYTIKYYDSLSKDKDETLVEEIRTKIKSSLVDETTGELKPGNWGIQEMKTYAEFLAYKEDYMVHEDKESGEKFKLWAEPHRLNSEQVLSYEFGLLKATLVLVVDPDVKTKPNDNLQKDLGIYFKDFEDNESFKAEIHSLSPQFLLFVLSDKDNGKTQQILEFIKNHHLRLPARILIVTKDKNLELQDIPKRRVEYIDPDWIKYPSDRNSRQGWEKFFIAVYKKWIIKHSGQNCFNLGIYFDHPKNNSCEKKWQQLRCDLKKYDLNNFVTLHLYNQDKKPSSRNFTDVGSLCFDNHSTLTNAFKSPSFYQVVGHDKDTGGNNHTIFDQLQNVPSGFSAMIFILQLIETSLLKVLIIDDRMASHVVEITKEGNIQFKKPKETVPLIARRLVDANVFFNLSFNFNGKKAWLVKTYEQKDTNNKKILQEGVNIEGNKANKIVVFKDYNLDLKGKITYTWYTLSALDTIVIHWGWLETLKKDKTLDLDINEFLESLTKEFSSRIILTSGRGRSNIPEEYPFIEFSTIESYAMRELSKYHLGKILMSVF